MNEELTPVEKLINEISNSGNGSALPIDLSIKDEKSAKQKIISALLFLNKNRGVKISDIHVTYNHDEKESISINCTYLI